MTNDAVVSVVNTHNYGRSKKYKIEDVSEATVVQWAVETKQLLLSHPDLAKVKLVLKDSIQYRQRRRMLFGGVRKDWRQSRRTTRQAT